ncbi:DUF3164 family protein [Reichenbachiella sp.]|uniref:DUF3164 family protein n=1 Tax=Reichenbachiella sp. TaxID=2184521 RepID=UPI003B5CE8EC
MEVLDQMTEEQLEAALVEKRKAKAKAQEKARQEYEKQRDLSVLELMDEAQEVHTKLQALKIKCHEVMNDQETKLQAYGGIRSNSKGGFSITDSEQLFRVTRRRDTEPVWDERGQKAIELIKEFLHDTVKKRDLDLFEILMSFLEKNKTGDLEYGRVFSLMSHEQKFTDERWREGLRLLKESFSHHLKGFGYEFKTKGADEKWETLPLNFSAV